LCGAHLVVERLLIGGVAAALFFHPLLLLLRWNVLFISIAAAASAASPSIILRVGDATDEKEDGGRGQDSGSIHWVLPPGNHPWRIAKVFSDFL
jgi:hypothetical protein